MCCLVAAALLAQGPDANAADANANAAAYTPLSPSAQFHKYFKSLISPEAFARAVVGAGISQWTDTPHEWGQGAEGYGLRFANAYGEHIIRQTTLYAFSDALGEDNRFSPSERSGFGARAMYAIESPFLARRPNGKRRLSYSRLGAVFAAAFISREWQPRSTDNAQHAMTNVATTLGSEIGFNVAREFLPKIFGH